MDCGVGSLIRREPSLSFIARQVASITLAATSIIDIIALRTSPVVGIGNVGFDGLGAGLVAFPALVAEVKVRKRTLLAQPFHRATWRLARAVSGPRTGSFCPAFLLQPFGLNDYHCRLEHRQLRLDDHRHPLDDV